MRQVLRYLPELLILFIGIFVLLFRVADFPVFADEAIYIKWAQIARNDPAEYAFLPMLDGKPPLHVWSISALLPIFSDPLVVGRAVSIFFGLITVLLLWRLSIEFQLQKWPLRLVLVLGFFTPYFFHIYRLSLAESMLGAFFLGSLLCVLRLTKKQDVLSLVLLSILIGASLWVKTTALFFIPTLIAFWWFWRSTYRSGVWVAVGLLGGLGLFGLLALHPLFSSLFSRSTDYTFTVLELLKGEWKYVLFASFPRVAFWIIYYLSPIVILASFFDARARKLLIVSLIYILPIVVLGRVLTTRYLYPMMPVMLLAGGIGLSALKSKLPRTFWITLIVSLLFIFGFVRTMIFDQDFTPFVREDRQQYLEDWSSGHGLREISIYIREYLSQDESVRLLVATEGYFGTLPDGLQIFFDRFDQPERLEIYGVGQPIYEIPEALRQEAQQRTVFLVVNEHRFFDQNTDSYEIVKRFSRPGSAPQLLLIEVQP